MSRQAMAYLVIGLAVLLLAAMKAWTVYHSRDWMVRRRRNRDRARRERGADENEGGELSN